MEYKSSFDRIDNVRDIDYISKNICKDYCFGDYINYEIIETGYEDFNYYLYTGTGRYVVKIFNTERTDSSCVRLINILVKSLENGIPVPMLYKYNNKYIYEVSVNDKKLKLFVMKYIGFDYWEMKRPLNDQELGKVARIAAKIDAINYGIKEPFYDEWTVTNLLNEYNKKKHCLTPEDDLKISKIVKEFALINFKKIKYAYIHGDIIKANLLLDDKTKEIYVIDFSDFNYLPRIVELVASMLGLCLTNDKKTTVEKMNLFLNCYNKYNSLESYEIEILPLMLKALASMYVIQASYINYNLGDYTENDYWLSEGRKYLNMEIGINDFKID